MPYVQPPAGEPATAWVFELAAEYDVSERTVWRWLATGRTTGRLVELDRCCETCGEDLPLESTVRRRYCDDTCRVAGWRSRRPGEALPDRHARDAASPQ